MISPTELMKKLKFIEQEIISVHEEDEHMGYIPAEKTQDEGGNIKLCPLYKSNYDFGANRSKVKELQAEEIKIKKVLADFNYKTKVIGYDFTISEGLIKLAQLKSEVRTISNMVNKGQYVKDSYRDNYAVAAYDLKEAKEELKKAQKELSTLQVALDKTNLTSSIDY